MAAEEEASAQEPADAKEFREAQVGATFLMLKMGIKVIEKVGERFDVNLEGLSDNCMEDEILCTSYAQWVKTRLNTSHFTPGWMFVFALGSQIMHTRNINNATRQQDAPRGNDNSPEFDIPREQPAPRYSPDPVDVYFTELHDGPDDRDESPMDFQQYTNVSDDDLDRVAEAMGSSQDVPDTDPLIVATPKIRKTRTKKARSSTPKPRKPRKPRKTPVPIFADLEAQESSSDTEPNDLSLQ